MEMKSRRYFLFLVLAGAGCRGSHQKDLLPMTLGEFRRIAVVQRWKPESRKIVFHEGPYFVVLESESNDAAGMNALAAALEGSLKQ
jgi:hypothetical protein